MIDVLSIIPLVVFTWAFWRTWKVPWFCWTETNTRWMTNVHGPCSRWNYAPFSQSFHNDLNKLKNYSNAMKLGIKTQCRQWIICVEFWWRWFFVGNKQWQIQNIKIIVCIISHRWSSSSKDFTYPYHQVQNQVLTLRTIDCNEFDRIETNSSNSQEENTSLQFISSSILALRDKGKDYWKGDSLCSYLCMSETMNFSFRWAGVIAT